MLVARTLASKSEEPDVHLLIAEAVAREMLPGARVAVAGPT